MKKTRYFFNSLGTLCILFQGVIYGGALKSDDAIQIQAPKFIFDLKTQVLTGVDGITAHKNKIKIVSSSLSYAHKTNTIWLNDGVDLHHEDLRITSQRMGSIDQFVTILCQENVNAFYLNIEAHSDQGKYFIKPEQMVLSGNPRAKQGLNEVRGREITIDLLQKKVISSGKAKVKVSAETLEKNP